MEANFNLNFDFLDDIALDPVSLTQLDHIATQSLMKVEKQTDTIASGVQRHMQEDCNRRDINIFQKSDTSFKTFRSALQSRTKQLLSKGVGVSTKHKDPVTSNDE